MKVLYIHWSDDVSVPKLTYSDGEQSHITVK